MVLVCRALGLSARGMGSAGAKLSELAYALVQNAAAAVAAVTACVGSRRGGCVCAELSRWVGPCPLPALWRLGRGKG